MVINCNVPSFQNLSTDQKLKKMERYLYDLNDQLRVILNNLELDNFTLETREAVGLSQQTKEAIQTDFNALKQAIIKTAVTVPGAVPPSECVPCCGPCTRVTARSSATRQAASRFLPTCILIHPGRTAISTMPLRTRARP